VCAHVRWVIKAVGAGSADARRARDFHTDMILVDAPDGGGAGKVFDWTLLGEVQDGPRVILAGGLTPDNVADAVRTAQPWGVDVSSGVEKSPGRKDPLKVKAFIDRARAAAPSSHRGPDDMPYDWADDE
jgi:phosphoribosylanthranilate isomerase